MLGDTHHHQSDQWGKKNSSAMDHCDREGRARVAIRAETGFYKKYVMKSRIYAARIIGVLAVAIAALLHVAGKDRNSSKSRLVRAAKPGTPTPFKPPNRLIWRLSEILAAHKGQASWWQPVVKTRDFEADWISMAPGAKTTSFTPTIAFSGSRQGKCG
jgi:hypothetical protein